MIVGIVIPSRLESTRLSQKALRPIAGIPLVVRAWRQASQVGNANWVLVATDSPQIAATVAEAGGRSILTSSAIASGTERLAAVDDLLDTKADVYVNFQGDEPFLEPENVETAIRLVTHGGFPMATLSTPLMPGELELPSAVKVTTDATGRATAFSRSPLPNAARHLGLYVFTRQTLLRIRSLPPSASELREKLEQLRAQDDGIAIGVASVQSRSFGIDTPLDLARAEQMA